ncbi:MAG: hypothetical protein JKY65_24575, partial [Planctomycetes bacterium]|nr:hypothetical protein [Planctomycetota bacterium]
MSDLEIRAQKRAGPALRQEIRIGELELRRVQLAAWLGYGPALEAAEGVGPDVPATEPAGDSSRVRQVLQWGGLPKPMLVGLACDMAERVAHGLEGEIAIKAARDWLACPCE